MGDTVNLVINGRFLEKRLGGIGRYAIGVTQELMRRGLALWCATSRAVMEEPATLPEGVGAIGVGMNQGHIWEQWDLPRHLKQVGRPLLLNMMNTAPITYGRQVTVIHDVAYLRCPRSFTSRFRWFYRYLIPRAAAASLKVVTDSHFSKGELVAALGLEPSAIEVVYPFISPSLLQLAAYTQEPVEERPYALIVSALNPRKNLRRALEAFALADVRDLRLVIVGERKAVYGNPELEGLLPSHIEIRSGVKDAELVRLYKGARVFIYPSLYEGFGLPPVEAMA